MDNLSDCFKKRGDRSVRKAEGEADLQEPDMEAGRGQHGHLELEGDGGPRPRWGCGGGGFCEE